MDFLIGARALLRALIFLQESRTERSMIGDTETAEISIFQHTVC